MTVGNPTDLFALRPKEDNLELILPSLHRRLVPHCATLSSSLLNSERRTSEEFLESIPFPLCRPARLSTHSQQLDPPVPRLALEEELPHRLCLLRPETVLLQARPPSAQSASLETHSRDRVGTRSQLILPCVGVHPFAEGGREEDGVGVADEGGRLPVQIDGDDGEALNPSSQIPLR